MAKKRNKKNIQNNAKSATNFDKKIKKTKASKSHKREVLQLKDKVKINITENPNEFALVPNADCRYTLRQIFNKLHKIIQHNKKFSGITISRSSANNWVLIKFANSYENEDKKAIAENFLDNNETLRKKIKIIPDHYQLTIDTKNNKCVVILTESCPYTAKELADSMRRRMASRKEYQTIKIHEANKMDQFEMLFDKPYSKQKCQTMVDGILLASSRKCEKVVLKSTYFAINVDDGNKAILTIRKTCPYTASQIVTSLTFKITHNAEYKDIEIYKSEEVEEVIIKINKTYEETEMLELVDNLLCKSKKENKKMVLEDSYFVKSFDGNNMILEITDSCPYLLEDVVAYINRQLSYWPEYTGIKCHFSSVNKKLTLDFKKYEGALDKNMLLAALITKSENSHQQIILDRSYFHFAEDQVNSTVIITLAAQCPYTIDQVAGNIKSKILLRREYGNITINRSTTESNITLTFKDVADDHLQTVYNLLEDDKTKRETIKIESHHFLIREAEKTLILTLTQICPYTTQEVRSYLRERTVRSTNENYNGITITQNEEKKQLIIDFLSSEEKDVLLDNILALIGKTNGATHPLEDSLNSKLNVKHKVSTNDNICTVKDDDKKEHDSAEQRSCNNNANHNPPKRRKLKQTPAENCYGFFANKNFASTKREQPKIEESNEKSTRIYLDDDNAIKSLQKQLNITYLRSDRDCEKFLYIDSVDLLKCINKKQNDSVISAKECAFGVFARQDIVKDKIICQYMGDIFQKERHIVDENYVLNVGGKYFIDATIIRNVSAFINGSTINYNAELIEQTDDEGNTIAVVQTTVPIRKDQQVIINYGKIFNSENFICLNPSNNWLTAQAFLKVYKDFYEKKPISLNEIVIEDLPTVFGLASERYYILPIVFSAVLNGRVQDLRNKRNLTDMVDLPLLANRHNNEINLFSNTEIEYTTALMLACYLGKVEDVQLLLAIGANPNAQQTYSRATAIYFAMISKVDVITKGEIISQLLDHGANPLIQLKNRSNIFHLCAISSEMNSLTILFFNRVTDNNREDYIDLLQAENEAGYNPLLLAIKYKNIESFKLFMKFIGQCNYNKNNDKTENIKSLVMKLQKVANANELHAIFNKLNHYSFEHMEESIFYQIAAALQSVMEMFDKSEDHPVNRIRHSMA